MELRHLRYFLVLSEELHFGRAARKLNIAQPPLSRQIKNLEEELGVDLFKRTKRHVELTPYGKYLKQETLRLLQHVETVRNHLGLLKRGAVGQVKIGYVGSAMHSVLPRVLSEVKNHYPDVNTVMMEMDNEDQIDALKSGDIDIGVVRTPMQVTGVTLTPIYSETLSVILSQSHPRARSRKFTLADMADEPFISFCRRCAPGLYDRIVGLCNKNGFCPRIVHETSQINSVVRLVESNLGYSIVPTSVRSGYRVGVKFFELDDYPERAELALAYCADHMTPTSKHIIDLALSLKSDFD